MNVEGGPTVVLGLDPIGLEDIERVATQQARVVLSTDPAFRARLQRSREVLDAYVASGRVVYGVTTGFGESVTTAVSADFRHDLARNIVRFHGVGTGRILTPEEGRAVLLTRIAALARGGSAVREVVLERLVALLQHDLIPAIPAEGSVGASGDLTPLSYIGAVLIGEREVWSGGHVVPAATALAEAGIEPIVLHPKEGLAIMNGTSVMTGLAALALIRARRLADWACTLTGMASDVLRGNAGHFDDRIYTAKPHPGQRDAARRIREHLGYDAATHVDPERIQDRYSIRCAPHVIGVLYDVMPLMTQMVEIELNGVNDNPVVDPDSGAVLHGGNFYGGHIAWAMDSLKAAVASVADLLDRQMELMGNPITNAGLPANLVAPSQGAAANHGVKAMQIATSALTAEALKLTMPAASFSRSTECHNQDKVSMGTIASRDALRVLELSERVAAIHLIAACQAADLRSVHTCKPATQAVVAMVRTTVPFTVADRRHDLDIASLAEQMRTGSLMAVANEAQPAMAGPYPITAMAMATALGRTTVDTWSAMRAGGTGLSPLGDRFTLPFETWFGVVPGVFAPAPSDLGLPDTAQARLTAHVYAEIAEPVRAAVARWGPTRVAVLVGTTTGGIADTERAYARWDSHRGFDGDYGLETHHGLDRTAELVARLAGAHGPRWSQSSACSSATKVFGSAKRLLDLGLADAVIVGGVDTRCAFTLLGFHSLGVLSPTHCRPFGQHRDGINLGEGGALLLIERHGDADVCLAGVGETSDAFHMTQPRPDGSGLATAVLRALDDAGLDADQVDLVNAHATGTLYNDAAESAAFASVLGHRPPVVGTKALTGHTLGACGAVEAVICALALTHGWSPGTHTEGGVDPELDLDVRTEPVRGAFQVALNCTAAFAGHNCAMLLVKS